MKNKPLDFQQATASHVLEAFKQGQRRVLVADEAGLGKTTVASEVVKRVKDLPGVLADDLYCIVYVCCNLQIAQQNIDTLSDEGENVDLAQSRLSMQHYVYYRKKKDLSQNNKDTLVLSLTPATSFQITNGTGNVDERALIYACLSLLPEYNADSKLRDRLKKILQGSAQKSWKDVTKKYCSYVNAAEMQPYRFEILPIIYEHLEKPYSEGLTIRNELLRLTADDEIENRSKAELRMIVTLRKMFAKISLKVLRPDLVIMDEFQKFSSLISTEEDESRDSEESMVARNFFDNHETYILLLSATPYKPFTTLEELNETNIDEQYRDFHRLLDFLYKNTGGTSDIKIIWQNYSSALSSIEKSDWCDLLAKHHSAENMLYKVMGRTERQNTGIIHEELPDISPYLTESDILSYIQMQHLIDLCHAMDQRIISAPTDYTKSAAFQLSFMDNYKLKEEIQKGCSKVGASKIAKNNINCLLLNEAKIRNYSLSQYYNARLSFVITKIFGDKKNPTNVEQLLWVPTSHPYYKTKESIFTRNKDFSKYMVFSSWGMVPKMMASLISYEAERRLYKRAYKQAEYTNDVKTLLRDDKKSKNAKILYTVSTYLTGLYRPDKDYGKSLEKLKIEIKEKIKAKLQNMGGERTNRMSSTDILELMDALDNDTKSVRKIYSKAEDVLTEIAIASPASCLFRSLHRICTENVNDIKSAAEDIAKKMVGIFNNRYGIAAVKLTCNKSKKDYFLEVLEYCTLGNLQATTDEFIHMIGEFKSLVKITDRIKESFVSASPQPVDTLNGFFSGEKFSMRKHFAIDFGNIKQTENAVEHSVNVRSAFNSPFRPFVLASTSVGQEGLDFHWYCRKMIHWNLPSNPQNLEQREGRINRYKCLSVRRNIAKVFGDYFTWNDMFSEACKVLKQKKSDMVPYWYLPLENEIFEGRTDLEYIERIVPIYPMSEEQSRYQRLINILSLYRLTMGQPRQEDLLQMLEGKIPHDKQSELLFDLSPISRNTKT